MPIDNKIIFFIVLGEISVVRLLGPEAVIFVNGLKVARTLAKDFLAIQFKLLTVGSRVE